MRFRKRDRNGPPRESSHTAETGEVVGHLIEFDDLVKGTLVTRRGKDIRQFNVYVNGSIRLVTSGDTVDQATYDALIKAGAVVSASVPPVETEEPEDG
jgi:hypothetical protein